MDQHEAYDMMLGAHTALADALEAAEAAQRTMADATLALQPEGPQGAV